MFNRRAVLPTRPRRACYSQDFRVFPCASRWSRSLPKRQQLYEIERKPLEVTGLVQAVQANADSHREALGFLPTQAYEQAARQETLFVAVEGRGEERRYAGHILFGATYPHAKIYQLFVVPPARKHGIGRLLVEALLKYAEKKQYLSVTARVAADLEANAFWSALKFETVGTKSGGAMRGRTINIRARQLNTPALFGYREPVTGIPLTEPLPNFTAVFALDLNIFFDVVRHRPRSEFGAVVMSAAFNNIVRLAVTEEFTRELKRSASNTHDPVLEFALQLPTLPAPVNGLNEQLMNELAAIVFPERASAGKLSAQDRSDLIHVAIAAHHKIAGFVTAEDALVKSSQTIETQFGVRIVHVRDLAEILNNTTNVSSPLDIGFADRDLCLSEINSGHASAIKGLADSVRLPRELRNLALADGVQASTRRSLAISFEGKVVCVAFWQPQSMLQGALEAFMLVDEDQASSVVAVNALLNKLSRIASSHGPARLQVVIPNSALATQEMAIRYGFTRCTGNEAEVSRYQRLSIGDAVSEKSWPSVREKLRTTTDMLFPAALPPIDVDDVRIQFENKDGKEFVIDLFDLETILSPTIFLLPGRSGILVPIRASYADDLLGTAAQASLLPRSQAAILHERTYFSSARNERLLRKGAPIVFYESGKSNGRSAAIAVARVTSTVIVPKRKVASTLIDSGVLDEEELRDLSSGEQIAATSIDNIMKLRKPVPLKRLRELGCVDGANLVTSRSITPNHLHEILSEGRGTCE
jgi:GNAT superfamily N-acetyltransferase